MSAASTPEFDHDAGWIAVPDVLSADEVAEVLSECHALLDLPITERLARDRPHSGTRHLDELHDRVDIVRSLSIDSVLTSVVATVLGATFSLGQAHYRCPQPGYGEQSLHAGAQNASTAERPALQIIWRA